MQAVDTVAHRERRAPKLGPGLEVFMFAAGRPAGHATLRIGARGGASPMRLHVYVDGELVESWTAAPPMVTVDLGAVRPGRHAVTARAIDATGRWGGTSIVIDALHP